MSATSKNALRQEMIDLILPSLKEIGDRNLVASRLGMTRTNLNYHMGKTCRYPNNLEKLSEIAKMVAIVLNEKRQREAEMVKEAKAALS